MNSQAPIGRVRILPGPARPARRRAATARAVFCRPSSLHSVDDAGRTEARVGLVVATATERA